MMNDRLFLKVGTATFGTALEKQQTAAVARRAYMYLVDEPRAAYISEF